MKKNTNSPEIKDSSPSSSSTDNDLSKPTSEGVITPIKRKRGRPVGWRKNKQNDNTVTADAPIKRSNNKQPNNIITSEDSLEKSLKDNDAKDIKKINAKTTDTPAPSRSSYLRKNKDAYIIKDDDIAKIASIFTASLPATSYSQPVNGDKCKCTEEMLTSFNNVISDILNTVSKVYGALGMNRVDNPLSNSSVEALKPLPGINRSDSAINAKELDLSVISKENAIKNLISGDEHVINNDCKIKVITRDNAKDNIDNFIKYYVCEGGINIMDSREALKYMSGLFADGTTQLDVLESSLHNKLCSEGFYSNESDSDTSGNNIPSMAEHTDGHAGRKWFGFYLNAYHAEHNIPLFLFAEIIDKDIASDSLSVILEAADKKDKSDKEIKANIKYFNSHHIQPLSGLIFMYAAATLTNDYVYSNDNGIFLLNKDLYPSGFIFCDKIGKSASKDNYITGFMIPKGYLTFSDIIPYESDDYYALNEEGDEEGEDRDNEDPYGKDMNLPSAYDYMGNGCSRRSKYNEFSFDDNMD